MLLSYYRKRGLEAGCDEAGRGCLAGPVFAAAVILPKNFYHPVLNDSKQVKEEDRYALRVVIEKSAISFAVARIDNPEIDAINILQASVRAMHIAVSSLTMQPKLLLVDGNYFHPIPGVQHQCVIGGDATYAAIAAASILAKTYRDDYMRQLHNQFPHYGWNENKGYATQRHREAIRQYGLSSFHRLSFRQLPGQLEFAFD